MSAFLYSLFSPPNPTWPWRAEGKKSLSQHRGHQRLSKASEQPGGADTVTMELTVALNLPHFPRGVAINNG